MNKILNSIIVLLIFLGCKTNHTEPNYFGQDCPDTIPVIFAPDIISVKGRLEHGLSFSPNTQELAFGVLNNENFSGELYYSKADGLGWTIPMPFKPVKGASAYLPYFSPNGKYLLYAQSKPDMDNGYTDIFIIEKQNGQWGIPENLNSPINSDSREANACMTKNGSIYFSSNRNCLGKADCHTADLFFAELNNGEYKKAEAISAFISDNDEESVFISPAEDYILFCRYTDTNTWMDLYISYRDYANNWTEAQLLNSNINSVHWDRRPFVTIDNKFLFFTRLQMGEKGLIESDIYWVKTTKVFKPFVYNPLNDVVLQLGKKVEVKIPENYFKDIDNEHLEINYNEEALKWVKINKEKMTLTMNPIKTGAFDLVFTANDGFANKTQHVVKITVD